MNFAWKKTQKNLAQEIKFAGVGRALLLWADGVETALALQEELAATTRNDLMKLATQAVKEIKSAGPKKP